MMKKLILGSALLTAAVFTSCEKEENLDLAINPAIVAQFQKDYPNAKNVNWIIKQGYSVATFSLDGTRAAAVGGSEAWYEMIGADAKCRLFEQEIEFNELPIEVQEGWENSSYKAQGYTIDDIDKLIRGSHISFKIEAEHNNDIHPEMDLFFDKEGSLISAKPDLDDFEQDDDNIPAPYKIEQYILTHYDHAVLLSCEIEKENGKVMYEVEFADKESFENMTHDESNIEKEAWFDADLDWVMTETEIEDEAVVTNVPQAVLDAYKSEHPGEEIEEVIRINFEDKEVYEFEEAEGIFYLANGEHYTGVVPGDRD